MTDVDVLLARARWLGRRDAEKAPEYKTALVADLAAALSAERARADSAEVHRDDLLAQRNEARHALRQIDMEVNYLREYPDEAPPPADVVQQVRQLIAEAEDLARDLNEADADLANVRGCLDRDKAEILEAFNKHRQLSQSRVRSAEGQRDEAQADRRAAWEESSELRAIIGRVRGLAASDLMVSPHELRRALDGEVQA